MEKTETAPLPDGFAWFIAPTDSCPAGIARRVKDRLRETLIEGNGQKYEWRFIRGDGFWYRRSNEQSARTELRRFKRGES